MVETAGTSQVMNPQVGMVATVRNRRGIVSSVRPFSSTTGDGVLHLVNVEYNDGDYPLEESLLWEREVQKYLVPPAALPQPDVNDPMQPGDVTALIRACRWTARTPFIDPDGTGPLDRLPVSSPFHGAVQVEDYQLIPLLKALRMPRVSLMIADDVGLGKTVEAGLILAELLLRRRIRRVLIATPAALRVQWQEEMWEKFSLPFNVVDRDSTMKLRRELGMDANPWRSNSRIITSYHYLKQPDVLEQFRVARQSDSGDAHLPWDLLIVDEAHNLTPSPFGDDSQLCQMLRHIAPMFEHRLFLTATPHNGHTSSYTGLLELLDPVRFSQKDEMEEKDRQRAQDVVVRRLKRDINARTNPPRFCQRVPPKALAIELYPSEQILVEAFNDFRKGIRDVISRQARKKRLAGNFAIEILGKRLLSCPVCFADSWNRCRIGMEEDEDGEISDAEVMAVKRTVDEETGDDREAESRSRTASTTVGIWMRPFADELSDKIAEIDLALEGLGLGDRDTLPGTVNPAGDSRFECIKKWIDDHLVRDGTWLDDERLVIFTEYKTTLDYLLRRFRETWPDDTNRFLSLYGGMDDTQREAVKAAFNDFDSPVRVLVGTDAASEGLNLQLTARYVLHYDVPWNPARVEQRNGRLDRHGQARDVHTFHFVSPEDQDLSFLDLVVKKVHTIREDLGTTGQVFDELTHRRLVEGVPIKEVQRNLDEGVETARRHSEEMNSGAGSDGGEEESNEYAEVLTTLKTIATELDFGPESLRSTLDVAMGIAGRRPAISPPDSDQRCSILPDLPDTWNAVIDDTLRLTTHTASRGALPKLTFDPNALVVSIGGRPVFRPRRDTALMHLGHPVIQRALSDLTRQRFPGGGHRPASRWTVFKGSVPDDADCLLRVTVEELAINELRETFHHWVQTIVFPVREQELEEPLPHQAAGQLEKGMELCPKLTSTAADIWLDIERDLKGWLRDYTKELRDTLRAQVEADRETALEQENARYSSRQGEVSALIETSTVSSKRRQLEKLRDERRHWLFEDETLDRMISDIERLNEEVHRSEHHYEELRDQLQKERDRIIKNLIPKRYSMRGNPQVMPVAVEFVMPG